MGLLLSPPSWRSREEPPRLLGAVQGPFLGAVQKSPKSKGEERESAGTWQDLEESWQDWRELVSAVRKIWKRLESPCFGGGSVQVDKELACGQQCGTRGQGVMFFIGGILKEPLNNCVLQGQKVTCCPSKSSEFMGIFWVFCGAHPTLGLSWNKGRGGFQMGQAGNMSQEGPRERW